MNLETVLYEKRAQDRIAIITMNRPDKLNALSAQLRNDILAALEYAEADPDVRATVLHGAGRAFSAGADMGGGRGPEPTAEERLLSWVDSSEDGIRRSQRRRALHKPVVAALHGYALGAGLELALSCDLIIAAQGTRLGEPEIRHGSIAATVLPWLVGPMWAKRIILTGDLIDAETAERIGLCVEVVPEDRLLERAIWLAGRIAKVPPLGVRFNKRMIDGIIEAAGFEQSYSYASLVAAICHSLTPLAETVDGRRLADIRAAEGLRGFLEARDAPFRE
jgi:enoyl-CoA hydratase/carnithine racemase